MRTLLRMLFLSLIASSMELPFGYGATVLFFIEDTTDLQETLRTTKHYLINKDTVKLSDLSESFSIHISLDENTINFTTDFAQDSENDFCYELIVGIFKLFPDCQWNVMGRLVRSEDYVKMSNGNLTVKLSHLLQPILMAMLPIVDKLLQDCTSFTWIESVIPKKTGETTGETLEGCNSGLTRQTLISFLQTLSNNEKIKKVDLSLNNISDETAIWICNIMILIRKSNIEKISLKSNTTLRSEVTESGYNDPWQEFIQILQNIEPTRSLDISLIGNRTAQERMEEFSRLRISTLINLHLEGPKRNT